MYSMQYQKSQGFTEPEIIARIKIADAITQMNALELEINDILAYVELKESGSEEVGATNYLAALEKQLNNRRIANKTSAIVDLAKDRELIDDAAASKAIDDFDKWRRTRNIFAHGTIYNTPDGIVCLYYNGNCLEVNALFDQFLYAHERTLAFMGRIEAFHSPFNGMPVLHNDPVNPDTPLLLKGDS